MPGAVDVRLSGSQQSSAYVGNEGLWACREIGRV